MSSHVIEDLTSSILDFQANIVSVTYRKKTTLVDHAVHHDSLKYIWLCSKAKEEEELYFDDESVDVGADVNGEFRRNRMIKWRKLGFETEDMTYEFDEVGVLGLDCLVRLRLSSGIILLTALSMKF